MTQNSNQWHKEISKLSFLPFPFLFLLSTDYNKLSLHYQWRVDSRLWERINGYCTLLISWRAQKSDLTSHQSVLSVRYKLADIKWSNYWTACWPNCFNRERAIPLQQTMSARLQLIHSHSPKGRKKSCYSVFQLIGGSEWCGRADAALMWPVWAELKWSL